MINNKDFWNDELVKEFFYEHYQECINALRATNTGKSIEDFKKSKQSPNKDYEIVSYINPNIVTDIKGGNIEKANSYASLRNYPIHSVKRLSDNEVFELHKTKVVDPNTGHEWVISEISLKDNKIYFNGVSIGHVQKIKERIPLFTTEQIEQIILIVRRQLKIYDENK